MPEHRRLRYGLISVAAGAACLALATPAWAGTVSLGQSGVPAVLTANGDPAGANGTVKIDGVPLDDGIDNEPHVTCTFAVDFFNFDKDQRANIVFNVQPPTGHGTELLRKSNVVVSDDAAGGGKPDPDKTFLFSATDLKLDAYTPQSNQGYHVKLTVELIGTPGAGKHKVFWIKPCAATGGTPSGAPQSAPASGASNDSGTPAAGSSNGAPGGGGLPITGAPIGGIAALGAAAIAAGAGLLIWRRRRTITG